MSKLKSSNILATNKKAYFLYTLYEKYEAGIQLLGSEVKSIREGKLNIKEAYVKKIKNELFVVGMHIGEYSHSGYSYHDPLRDKKILLHKNEINRIIKDVEVKGKTIVPLKAYIKNGKIKIQISLAKGKKIWDKRESKKNKDIDRKIDQLNKGL